MTQLISSAPLDYQIFIPGVSSQVKQIVDDVFQSKYLTALKELFENNPWHDREEVYSHVQVVFANLQLLLQLEWVNSKQLKNEYQNYLVDKPPNCNLSRIELLLIACALHDLSKGQNRPYDDNLAPGEKYLLVDKNGNTRGTGHELGSAKLAPIILKKSKIDDNSLNFIQQLIEKHDQFSLSFCQNNFSSLEQPKPNQDAQVIKNTAPNNGFLLLLHIIADEHGAAITQKLRSYLLNEVMANYSVI